MLYLLASLALVLGGCAGPSGPDEAPVKRFRTTRCKEPAQVPDQAPPEGEWGYTRWRAPAHPPLPLWELEGEVHGEPPDEVGTLDAWNAQAIASSWERSTEDGQVRWLSEPMRFGKGAAKVRLQVTPGAARNLTLVTAHKLEVDRRVRGLRSTAFTLDQGEAERVVTLEVDLDVVLRENWGDDRRSPPSLRRLEVSLPEDQLQGFSIEEVAVLDKDAALPLAAGRTLGDVGGRLHPSWYVRPRRHVDLRVQLPEVPAELRWMGATTRSKGQALVRVRPVDGEPVELASNEESHEWTHRTASLAPWAGQEVVITLAAEGSRVQLFGDPRIVVPDQRQEHVPSVVIWLVDTLRADHLGAWGHDLEGVSPRIDEAVAQSVMFSSAISSASWTKPAIPTVLTGLWATTHGVGETTYSDKLPATAPTVQDTLRRAGWRTGSFSANPLGSTMSGLERGFDLALPPHHWRGRMPALRHPSAAQLAEAFLDWQAEEPDQPFFAYIHSVEPHAWRRSVYEDPPDGYTTYDYAIQDADTQFGAFLDQLEERGLDQDVVVVFLADHGESFGDHGVKAHGTGLWQSQVHIPLFFWAPGDLPPMRTSQVVGLADVTPTVVDLVGLDPLPGADGTSLVPAIQGQVVHESVPAARVRYVWKPDDPPMHAVVRQDRMKAIRIGDEEQVFDLSTEPCEKRTAGVSGRQLFESLDAHLAEEAAEAEAFRQAHGAGAAESMDAASVEMLREMGYLE